MEFGWSAEASRYRDEIRAFLDETLPDNWDELRRDGVASPQQIEYSRTFCARMAERNLLVRHWPREYGGADASAWEHFVLGEEMWAIGEPRGPQYMNVNWIGPALMKFGTEAQKAEHLGRIAGGQVIWCQGFSEPNAGSDLAAMRTRAERRGDVYVINGSKIWTSYSASADWCFLLARTADEKKAISAFLLPMSTPGVSVHPIPGLTEKGHLNELFFTDVEVPVSSRVGEEGKGWEIVTYALNYERVGVPRYQWARAVLDRAVERLQREGRFDDEPVRAAAGRVLAACEAARMVTYVVVDQRARGLPPTPDASVSRLASVDCTHMLNDFIAEYLPDALLDGDPVLNVFYRFNMAASIAAGTYEIQAGIVAQRCLELPKGA